MARLVRKWCLGRVWRRLSLAKFIHRRASSQATNADRLGSTFEIPALGEKPAPLHNAEAGAPIFRRRNGDELHSKGDCWLERRQAHAIQRLQQYRLDHSNGYTVETFPTCVEYLRRSGNESVHGKIPIICRGLASQRLLHANGSPASRLKKPCAPLS